MRKRKYRKRRKRGRGKPYIRKNKVYFGGRRPYLRKNKVYFGESRKTSQKGDKCYFWNTSFDSTTFSWRNCKSI